MSRAKRRAPNNSFANARGVLPSACRPAICRWADPNDLHAAGEQDQSVTNSPPGPMRTSVLGLGMERMLDIGVIVLNEDAANRARDCEAELMALYGSGERPVRFLVSTFQNPSDQKSGHLFGTR